MAHFGTMPQFYYTPLQLENCYADGQAQIEKGGVPEVGPHLLLEYPESTASVVHDANELLIHHVKRQQNISKKEKFMIKKHLRCLIPRLFNLRAECMSDDEDDEADDSSGKCEEHIYKC